jgi:hypothetical protein
MQAMVRLAGVLLFAAPARGLPILEFVESQFGHDEDVHPTGIEGLAYPQNVTVSADGRSVYAVSDEITSGIAIFGRTPPGPPLTYVGAVLEDDPGVSGMEFNKGVTVSPDGRHVYVPRRRPSSPSSRATRRPAPSPS